VIGVGLGPTLIGALSVLMAQHAFGAGNCSMLCPLALRPREPRLPWHRPVARLRAQASCSPRRLFCAIRLVGGTFFWPREDWNGI
jgi:hypothetical protein